MDDGPTRRGAFRLAQPVHENSEMEDFSASLLTYANGSVAQITASLVHHGEEQQLAFQGERAKVAVPWQVKAATQNRDGFPEDNPAMVVEIQAFYDQLPPCRWKATTARSPTFSPPSRAANRSWWTASKAAARSNWSRRFTNLAISASGSSCRWGPTSPFYCRDGLLRRVRHFHETSKRAGNHAAEI